MKLALVIFISVISLGFSKQKPPTENLPKPAPKLQKGYPDSFTLKLTREGNLYTAQGVSPIKSPNVKLVWHVPGDLKVNRGLITETLSLDVMEEFSRTLMIESIQEPHSKPVVVEVYIETPKGKFGATATEAEPALDPSNTGTKQKALPQSEGRHRVIQ